MALILNEATVTIIALAVEQELTASHTYKHLANQMQRIGYFGASKYFRKEAKTEVKHYEKHVDFINNMGGVVTLPELQSLDSSIQSLRSALSYAYNMELSLMDEYSKWYTDLLQKGEAVVAQHLLQFLQIQQESVGEYGDWLARVTVVEGDTCGLLLIDQEMGNGI